MTDLCTQRYVVNGAKYGDKILCDKIDNIQGKLGCKEFRKRKFSKQLEQPKKKLQNIKNLEKNGKNHLRNIIRKNLITKDKMLQEQLQKTKVDANVGNVEN